MFQQKQDAMLPFAQFDYYLKEGENALQLGKISCKNIKEGVLQIVVWLLFAYDEEIMKAF